MRQASETHGASIQVIERMARLLDAINDADRPASLKLLAADTGLHPSTAHRILASMIDIGFVARTDTGDYQLGKKLMILGCRVRARLDIRDEAQEIMDRLRDEVGETVNLTIREGDQVVYIARAMPNRMMRVEQVVGSRAPLHVTAVGKLMLAAEGKGAIAGYAKRTRLPAFTKNTLVDEKELRKTAEGALERGYALDNEEAEEGVGCIGALIYDSSGEAVAGLSVSAPIERRREGWYDKVMAAAAELSARLGYRGEQKA